MDPNVKVDAKVEQHNMDGGRVRVHVGAFGQVPQRQRYLFGTLIRSKATLGTVLTDGGTIVQTERQSIK